MFYSRFFFFELFQAPGPTAEGGQTAREGMAQGPTEQGKDGTTAAHVHLQAAHHLRGQRGPVGGRSPERYCRGECSGGWANGMVFPDGCCVFDTVIKLGDRPWRVTRYIYLRRELYASGSVELVNLYHQCVSICYYRI